jgi:plastocyanin
MKALAAAYVLVAALAAPALLWAADDPPSDPAAATTPAAPAPAPVASVPPAPAPAAPPATIAQKSPAEEITKTDDLPAAKPKARAAGTTAVPIKNFEFKPSKVTVNVDDTVSWTNEDSAPHTATASDGTFDTGNLKKGASGSHKFTKAGSFAYICAIHPNMKGTVVVKAASSGSDDTGSSGSDSSGSGSSDSSGSSDTFQLDDSSSSGASGSSDSSSLANTGGNIATTALVGLLFLASGVMLRRRFRQYY